MLTKKSKRQDSKKKGVIRVFSPIETYKMEIVVAEKTEDVIFKKASRSRIFTRTNPVEISGENMAVMNVTLSYCPHFTVIQFYAL
jgi:hypothetical protein